MVRHLRDQQQMFIIHCSKFFPEVYVLMKTYVKIEGKDVEPIVQKLAKLSLDMPEVCVWDMNMVNMGWSYPTGSYSANTMGEMGLYLGMDQGAMERNCDRIISKTSGDLGDSQIYFEWHEKPTDEQLSKLKNMIDGILKPYGNKYHITNKN